MKSKTYATENGIKWKAIIGEDGFVSKVKMLTKVSRGYYYSCLNDVGFHYEELLSKGILKINEGN